MASARTIVALMGPTAAGKTELALALAERFPVALISVDSAMVYRGMDIGTAKPDAATLARHPHALIDVREPNERYSVADFLDDARRAIEAALEARRIPVLVGGTMMYFKAFREGIAEIPASSPDVRRRLEARAAGEGLAALHRELAAIDPKAAAGIHPNNPQRLLRALEVFETSGRPLSWWWQARPSRGVAESLDCALVEFALVPERHVVSERVERRFESMLERGFVDEVVRLRARGDLEPSLPSMRSVGYRQVWEYLEGACDRATMIERAVRATRQLAKRQFTWLRSFSGVRTIEATGGGTAIGTGVAAGEILQYLDAVAILDRLR